MKTLIICISISHGNTKNIAKSMAEILDAEVVEPVNIDVGSLDKYELIGFGSGIYAWKHHKSLTALIDRLSHTNSKAFIFSTRGNFIRLEPLKNYHKAVRNKLLEKGVEIVGEFSCLGFDTSGPLRFVGGKNKGHPDEKDLYNARKFALGIMNGFKFTEIQGS